MVRRVLLVLALAGGTGCYDDRCGDDCRPPASAAVEMAALGATLTTQRSEGASDIQATISDGETPFVSARLSLYFSPKEGEEFIEGFNPADSEYSIVPYEIEYSRFEDGIFVPFEGLVSFDGNPSSTAYYRLTVLDAVPADLLVEGNHLVATLPFSAPARATHVALYWRPALDQDPRLVRRVELDALSAWQAYIDPLLLKKISAGATP